MLRSRGINRAEPPPPINWGGCDQQGYVTLAQAGPGDDPLLDPNHPEADKEAIAQGLRERLRSGKLKPKDKKRAEERLRKFDRAKHPSGQIHADYSRTILASGSGVRRSWFFG